MPKRDPKKKIEENPPIGRMTTVYIRWEYREHLQTSTNVWRQRGSSPGPWATPALAIDTLVVHCCFLNEFLVF